MTTAAPRKRAPAKPKKALDARQAEADGFVEIEQCGITLRVPVGDNVPLEAYIAFKNPDDEDAELHGTKLLLGEEQWAAFLAKKPCLGDFNEIGDKLTALLGN